MPSFQDLIGVIVATYLTCALSGRMDLFYRGLAYAQVDAMNGVSADWGSPSIFRSKH